MYQPRHSLNVVAAEHDRLADSEWCAPPSTVRRAHARWSRRPRQRALTGAVAAAVVASLGLSVGTVYAAPEQGGVTNSPGSDDQGGVTNSPGSDDQGGVTTTPPPAPPTYDPGPTLVPPPPPGQWEQWQAPDDGGTQSVPYPQSGLPRAVPRATPPVKRIIPPPDTLRVGNLEWPVKRIPEFPNKIRAVNSANQWAAYAEAEIARFLIAHGVPRDEASRRAAAAVIGVAVGGGIGFAVGFTTTMLVVGPVLIPLATLGGAVTGAIVGSVVPLPPGPPVNTLVGAGIGAGVGLAAGTAATVFVSVLAGTAGAAALGTIGGLLADALGAGDPNAHPTRPGLPWQQGPGERPPAPPNPGANQFEFTAELDNSGLPGGGSVRYEVRSNGSVDGHAQVGAARVPLHISADQANAPYRAIENSFGAGTAQAVRGAVAGGVKDLTATAQKVLPRANLNVRLPQLIPAGRR